MSSNSKPGHVLQVLKTKHYPERLRILKRRFNIDGDSGHYLLNVYYVSVTVLRIVLRIVLRTLSLILHNNNVMKCGYDPNSEKEETASERLCTSLKVVYHYVMNPGFEPLFVRLHSSSSTPPPLHLSIYIITVTNHGVSRNQRKSSRIRTSS